ncbi:MAG: cyclic nucleotide-binding domain-containing protein, partial [Ignavibacteria bacterium]|nr:cyclic nucleotide-binding domain-containing protein [Ignavibacteria bacterium]
SSVIRKKILGNQIFSKKIRLESDLVTLQKKGEQTIILQLQGQLFFGTTDQLLSELEPFLSKCRFVVLDMKRVQSVDYTAAHLMQQLKDRLKKNGAHLVITSIPLSLPTGQNVRSYLEDLGLHERNTLKFFGDLSSGLEWIEENILEEERGEENVKERKLDLKQIEFFKNFPDKYLSEIRKIVNETHYNTGEEIFHAGDESDEMYFIRRGNVRIMMPLEQGGSHHLITFASGAVFGDMSFLDKAHRSARAVAEDEVDLFVLSRDRFDKLVAVHPEIGGMVFERLAKTITARLRQSNIELKAQQEL